NFHSTVSSLISTMHSSVFGGLDSVSRRMTSKEGQSLKNEQPTFNTSFPLILQTSTTSNDGNSFGTTQNKRYRITIEEIPSHDDSNNGSYHPNYNNSTKSENAGQSLRVSFTPETETGNDENLITT